MWEEQSMGSQTLEILRQGVWASITGGWYFDPGLTVFSNTFHLYLWLLLLCIPYSFYLYLPSNKLVWITYCTLIGIIMTVIKFSNYFLHHVYDTKNCITEVKEPDGSIKRIEEEIELNDMSNKDVATEKQDEQKQQQQLAASSTNRMMEIMNSKDPKSLTTVRTDTFGRLTPAASCESLEYFDMVSRYKKKDPDKELKPMVHEKTLSDSDNSWIEINTNVPSGESTSGVVEKNKNITTIRAHLLKTEPWLYFDNERNIKDDDQLPSFQSVDSTGQAAAAAIVTGDNERRHSNFTNGSLNLLSTYVTQSEIKPTGSLELGYIDKNPNQTLDTEGFYFNVKNNDGVRRFRSTALETCCPPPDIAANTNSLEVIGCKNNKNHLLPLPSNSLTRNQYANISPYYCESEIVYPIAEQSDEHQTSHGPDTDVDCASEDSDLDENNQATEKQQQPQTLTERVEERPAAKPKVDIKLKDTATNSTSSFSPRKLNDSSKQSHSSDDQIICTHKQKTEDNADSSSLDRPKIIRKRNIKRRKRSRDIQDSPSKTNSDSSSLVELGLNMLYGNEEEEEEEEEKYISNSGSHKLHHHREPLKSDSKWSSSTTVSLEQDVSKVLEEAVLAAKSLGAIPKKIPTPKTSHEIPTPRSESQKCQNCSRTCSGDIFNPKDMILEQLSHKRRSSSLEDFYVEIDSSKIPIRLPFKHQIELKAEETSSSGSNNELSTLITPGQPLLAAILPSSNKDVVFDLSASSSSKSPKTFQRSRLQRSRAIKRRNPPGCPPGGADGFDEKRLKINKQLVMIAPDIWVEEETNKGQLDRAAKNRNKTTLDVEQHRWSPVEDQPASSSNTIDQQQSSSTGTNTIELATDSTSQGSSLVGDNSVQQTLPSNNNNATDGDSGHNRHGVKFIKMPLDGPQAKVKNYYKIKLLPWKVTMDRLGLLSLLDRNITLPETILTVCLGIAVSIFGALLLYLNFYRDFFGFIFCFIIASSQYSLCKSVQPDAASPTHGFNRIIAYSRPVYFCIFSTIILILHYHIIDDKSQKNLLIARDFLTNFILFFPLLFSIGLFPQINTFVMYCLEQIDIHVFGGNAMCNLIGSFYCVCRSIFVVSILTGLAYGGLSEEKTSQHILFSIYCACLMAIAYHLSRCTSDPSHIWNLIRTYLWMSFIQQEHKNINSKSESKEKREQEEVVEENENSSNKPSLTTTKEDIDSLPEKLRITKNNRLKNDVIVGTLIAIITFALHSSTVFTVLHSELCPILWSTATGMGLILHYLIPQARKQLPWMIINKPILSSNEAQIYHIKEPAKIMWFEKFYIYVGFLEKNVVYPLMALAVLTEESPKVTQKYGVFLGSIMVVICSLKFLRNTYSDQNFQYLIVTFTVLASKFDYQYLNETFLVTYFVVSLLFHKVYEFTLKIKFIITYIAPWQITWGSAFHAFAQPFSVPHSAMLFIQAGISALLSTPLSPFLGSAIFFTSYVRPVKFWERDYNTRRVDHSNSPLSSHLERNLGADDNNLNSIFYEHLTRSLQHSLCGDLALGRWGVVSQGDIFVMASDSLNCLIHIIEIGNGLITFQMRGLEFRGTYCQQREVEAITEGVEDNYRLCCCEVGSIANILSLNTAFHLRWLAWEVTATKYIVEAYSISDNSVVSILQVFEFRRVLVTYYVKSIIFYTIRSEKLETWLNSEVVRKTLKQIWRADFVELDPTFNFHIDEDYDMRSNGMTKGMFVHVYGNWIYHCLEKRGKNIKKQGVITLCFALSLLGRRALGAASQNMSTNVEFFLYGLHALFKGDFRITCARDEWVFFDMDLLKTVLAPAVRMSLKLHQDHFMSPDEYDELPNLFDAICKYEKELILSHEGDPAWRNAILTAKPSLMALRHVCDEGADEYKIIMLNKRHLAFRVIKINKECVRGLWAGQQQELVYLRNRNPERGSIQNARQSLRNIINSSCDQPIGYPIYVSPLTTSYAETNEQYCSLVGGSVTLKKIKIFIVNSFRRIRKRCGEGCSSGASNREELNMGHDGLYATAPANFPSVPRRSTDSFRSVSSLGRGSSLSRTSLGGNRGSFISVGKPASSTLVSLTGLFKEKDEKVTSPQPTTESPSSLNRSSSTQQKDDLQDSSVENECVVSRVRILDPNLVYDCINLGRRIDVSWPTEYMRCRGGRSYWKDWVPEAGMEGPIVHKWTPFHRDPNKRSHVDRTILLIQIDDKYVPIAESGVQDLGSEV